MTGGQMAPTTLLGQRTTTTPAGRDHRNDGYPLRLTEMLAPLDGVAFAARVCLHTPAHVKKARRALQRSFEAQLEKRGFSFVEFISACPKLGLTLRVRQVYRKSAFRFPGICKDRRTQLKGGVPASNYYDVIFSGFGGQRFSAGCPHAAMLESKHVWMPPGVECEERGSCAVVPSSRSISSPLLRPCSLFA